MFQKKILTPQHSQIIKKVYNMSDKDKLMLLFNINIKKQSYNLAKKEKPED